MNNQTSTWICHVMVMKNGCKTGCSLLCLGRQCLGSLKVGLSKRSPLGGWGKDVNALKGAHVYKKNHTVYYFYSCSNFVWLAPSEKSIFLQFFNLWYDQTNVWSPASGMKCRDTQIAWNLPHKVFCITLKSKLLKYSSASLIRQTDPFWWKHQEKSFRK